MNEINSIGKNKGSKVLRNSIIIVLVLIIVMLIAIAVLYFCTDLLKSDRELFFKYFSQISETENGFIEGNIQAFRNKQKGTPYENEGKFDFTIDSNDDSIEIPDKVNDFQINFSGKTDKANNKAEENIELYYSDDVTWPMTYKHDGDLYGIQTDVVSSKYITVENNNLKELVEKLGSTDVSNIPDRIEISESNDTNLQFTEEELKTLNEKYVGVLNNQLRDDQFKSEKSEDGTTRYILTMTNEEMKNLEIALLNELKTDDITLEKINNILSEQSLYAKNTIETKDIETLIVSLQEENVEEGQAQFIVTQKDSKLVNISFNQNDNSIQLIKTSQDDSINYKISMDLKMDTYISAVGTIGISAYSSVNYSGLNDLNNVKENYELGFIVQDDNGQEFIKYTYQFENNVNFVDSVDIDGLNEENAMILNDYDAETLQNFVAQVAQRIEQVNTDQMATLEFDYGNPLFFAMPVYMNTIKMYESAQTTISTSDMADKELQAFNNLFLKYQGEQRGTIAKSLIQAIESNNNDSDSEVTLEFAGMGLIRNEDLGIAVDYINNASDYQITFEYDDSGRINKAVIAGEFNHQQ